MIEPVLLYDYLRDGDLKPGEAILVFEDGKTRRVRESSLYQKEGQGVREPIKPKPASAVRSGNARKAQYRKKHVKRFTAKQRTPVYSA